MKNLTRGDIVETYENLTHERLNMGKKARREYFKAIYARYRAADAQEKSRILDEFCKVCRYNRKYAIAKLNGPAPDKAASRRPGRKRKWRYDDFIVSILATVWAAAGYLCSVRLRAALPVWLHWIRIRFQTTAQQENQLLAISARQIDRRLRFLKRKLRRSIYGRTKPGSLLKSQIPIKTDQWSVSEPGYTEIDLVSHSGNSAAGEFIHSLNQTDILTTWVETRAVLGKAEGRVLQALKEMREALPFPLKGIDSDNGSEFINGHLYNYCQKEGIQFTRGRPYKKDDNAHIEQKNWTHVRKLFGWIRYENVEALNALNGLYRKELCWLMNLFMPSMKLVKKIRVGSKARKVYDQPKTPLDRLIETGYGDKMKISALLKLRRELNPFELSQQIECRISAIQQLAAFRRQLSGKCPTDKQITKNIDVMNAKVRFSVTKGQLKREYNRIRKSGGAVERGIPSPHPSPRAG